MSTKPPMKISEEADQKQLDMATEQGNVYIQALKHMANDVADDGGEKHIGDYIVAYAIEDAEGMYWMRDSELQWQEPNGNIHIEVSVRDASDQRFIPNLDIMVTVVDPNGNDVGTHQQPFVWHPWLYHYGRNWQVEKSGRYTLRVQIAAPDFPRHDPKNGKRYMKDVEVVFPNVKINLESDNKEESNTEDSNGNMQIWVSPYDRGQWRVHRASPDKTIAVTKTQSEAIDEGIAYAKEKRAELLIQGEDGEIRERRSYGSDPYPPEG